MFALFFTSFVNFQMKMKGAFNTSFPDIGVYKGFDIAFYSNHIYSKIA